MSTVGETNEIKLNQQDFGTLAICAIRYCHGRMSYMPGLVQDIVGNRLKQVSDKDLHVMINDCKFQVDMRLYGDDLIDKPGWLKWEKELKAEWDRRGACITEK